MKNVFRFFGIIAIAAIIGFSFAACSDDEEGGASGLTVTDIPSKYDGKWAYVQTEEDYIWGAQTISERGTGTGAQINNGSVSIPMWEMNRGGKFDTYSGNDYLRLYVGISKQERGSVEEWSGNYLDDITMVRAMFLVDFKGGNATVSWIDDSYYTTY